MVVMQQNFLVEFGEDFCSILHDGNQHDLLGEVTALAKRCTARQRKKTIGNKPDRKQPQWNRVKSNGNKTHKT
jgi:hypothetical protein